jgi:hypothetical protein
MSRRESNLAIALDQINPQTKDAQMSPEFEETEAENLPQLSLIISEKSPEALLFRKIGLRRSKKNLRVN